VLGLGFSVNLLNLIFCGIVVYLAIRSYRNGAEKTSLYLAAAFIFFGLSHILFMVIDLFGLVSEVASFTSALGWVSFVMVIRIIGYLLIAIALFNNICKRS
jgi:hypothetical protein